ncbi:SCO2524 family protein [Streptomyces sp. NEAU-W12]|uniref:SCO2524 family protein n=1 Tax=Streptomyces sp. NEAU-W12 TaxID=2994668 RepID=UPI00224B363F|nr:SCO2524 family protein [Streptomyces sp. NEAU-W12]MCX2925509.1 SCO2524 family protein [Streptomyces sp. NEAU-W12]
MQIKPRQHLLDIWQAAARHSFDAGKLVWGDTDGLSSVADAERLLCLLYPATEVPAFRLDQPDTTERDVLRALERVGSRLEIPPNLITVLSQFMRTHTGPDDSPTFSGGHYFRPADPKQELTHEQAQLGVVDAYSMSVTLCLATLGFLKVYEENTTRPEVRRSLGELRDATNARLTAAMVSLLRSFTVNVFDAESEQGRRLIQVIGQNKQSDRAVLQQFSRRFRPLRATIIESLSRGIEVDESIRDESQLFECGWAWGVVKDAPAVVDLDVPVNGQPDGIADRLPYVYFTVVALDGIQDLFSERTLTLGLLDADQQKLAEALRLRWELSQQYWSAIARFGTERWPLEDLPWQTTGLRLESEYFSLTVAAILVHDLIRRRATDDDLTRTVAIMERLADRGRVTSRMTRDDPAVGLHHPGVTMPLAGSERSGAPLEWRMTDFSAQLLKRIIQLAALSRNIEAQDRLIRLGEQAFEHLWNRRIEDGDGAGLWDNAAAVFPGAAVGRRLSWSITERITECLVAARGLYEQEPIRSPELAELARELLSEATHLFGKEQLEASATVDGGRGRAMRSIENRLDHARDLVDERPATAFALALPVLRELDTLAQARGAAAEEM